METPHSIFSSSRSKNRKGDVRASLTRLGCRRMTALEPGAISAKTSPSHSRCACAISESQPISIRELVGTINGRENSVCGKSGATPNASTLGEIIDPPAERKYAVDPVGVATQTPSAGICTIASSSNRSPKGTMRGYLALAHDDVVEREVTPAGVFGFQARRALRRTVPARRLAATRRWPDRSHRVR